MGSSAGRLAIPVTESCSISPHGESAGERRADIWTAARHAAVNLQGPLLSEVDL